MTWIRSSLPLLLALSVLGGCGDDASDADAPPAPGRTPAYPLVRLLDDPDPEVRRRAAEDLGLLAHVPPEVARALLPAQGDEDPAVAAAAVAALDRLQPSGDVALRVTGPECFATVVEQACVRMEHMAWRRVDCALDEASDVGHVESCWMLVVVPAVYETTVRQVLAHPERARWHDARSVEAGDVPLASPSPPPPPPLAPRREVPPEGEPEGAQPGEVWCRYETASGVTWRRHPECEIPPARR